MNSATGRMDVDTSAIKTSLGFNVLCLNFILIGMPPYCRLARRVALGSSVPSLPRFCRRAARLRSCAARRATCCRSSSRSRSLRRLERAIHQIVERLALLVFLRHVLGDLLPHVIFHLLFQRFGIALHGIAQLLARFVAHAQRGQQFHQLVDGFLQILHPQLLQHAARDPLLLIHLVGILQPGLLTQLLQFFLRERAAFGQPAHQFGLQFAQDLAQRISQHLLLVGRHAARAIHHRRLAGAEEQREQLIERRGRLWLL